MERTKPLKIYLGDLTYTTVTLATEAFPLNVGFIASYCKKLFGDAVEITLFKYIEDIDKAVNESPPDILGLSNYCWSHNVSSEIFKMCKKSNPDVVTVWGGPNFPIDFPSQKKFMKQYPEVDVYVPTEGETGFSNIVSLVLKLTSLENASESLQKNPVEGCISRDNNGEIHYSIPTIRISSLNEIPSPYQNGMMDKFFDGKLTPMLQTNRGCPFHCTFCTDGRDEVNKINHFSIERVKSDIEYIAEHTPKNTHSLHISDLNFGMYPRDLEICESLAKIQQKFDYPKYIKCTTGKNQKDKIINAIKKLNNSLRVTMSVQSLDPDVLHNIRRDNISVDHMLALYPALKEADLQTTSEVILGLPGETFENHIQTLRDLVKARMDEIVVHTCMLLDGSEMGLPEERKKWEMKTKFRVLQRDFAQLSNEKKVIEYEEVVVGSKTMTFEEYIELRVLAFIIFVTNQGIVFDAIQKLLREQEIDVFELYYGMLTSRNESSENTQNAIEQFKNDTIDELWDSPKDLLENFQKDSEYKKLLYGEAGTNVIYHYKAVVISELMGDWTEHVIASAHKLIKNSKNYDNDLEKQFESVANYCRGLSHNVLGQDRLETNPQYYFDYNIPTWLSPKNNLKLDNFKLEKKLKVSFEIDDEQFKMVQDNIDVYGHSRIGKSKTLKMLPNQKLWRRPLITSNHTTYLCWDDE
ncbi:MAG: radical SAM protein [Thaumarchaeota archaeon]|nr:radical SAM protein [Nitrososphaerota archaeon]MBT5238191.1 radical SAM protein [Nitrososphaerota archaeon]MBT6171710.1 radical SAM protein [Nitrososphaerota archaeon]MBT6370323.1 radical SAM protein [Nitrososphaerota archaeon]